MLAKDQIIQALLAERPKFLAAAMAIVRDIHVAEDVYQDLFVKVLHRQEPFDSGDHLLAWSWQVARNRARELLRKQKKKPAKLDGEVLDLLVAETQQRSNDEISHKSQALAHCLGQLTNNARQIVKMRYVDGLRATEVAQQLGRKANAVYVSLSRIYRTLAECIQRRIAEEGAA